MFVGKGSFRDDIDDASGDVDVNKVGIFRNLMNGIPRYFTIELIATYFKIVIGKSIVDGLAETWIGVIYSTKTVSFEEIYPNHYRSESEIKGR